MRCIFRTETNPFFNLAAEEFVFKNFSGNTFMLWINEPAVIIGKHQNAFAEINHSFIKANDIKVVRRISGGGTVYHDAGNLNFSFISNADKPQSIDFSRFTLPVISVLTRLGIKAEIGLKNSIFIDNHKISGNAEHLYKNTILHHGTLLFSSNLTVLEKAIKPPPITYEDKAIKSVRSLVGNISDFLPSPLTMRDFSQFIFEEIMKMNDGSYVYSFSDSDKESIVKLANEKYETWEWNYGYSPEFRFKTLLKGTSGDICLQLTVKNGIIQEILNVTGAWGVLSESNVRHKYSLFNTLRQLLLSAPLKEEIILQRLNSVFPIHEAKAISDSIFIGKSF